MGGARKAVFGQGLDLGVFTLDRSALLRGLWRIAKRRPLTFCVPDVQRRYKDFVGHHVTRSYWEVQFRGEDVERASSTAARPAYEAPSVA